MLNGNVFYHGIVRKAIVSFGRLFSNIYIDRKQGDSVEGTTLQRLKIPLAYAPKEKWIVRLDSDPELNNHTYVSLPRMSFEITGYEYDSTRKVGKMQKLACHTDTNSGTVFSPVPYNLNISLYILTKTQEDALQIIEQILPTFAPEYTLSVQAVPEMNIIQDIPVLLNSISVSDEYDGTFETRRFVTHTLTFTLKLNLFGATQEAKPIYSSQANLGLMTTQTATDVYNAEGDPLTFNVTSQGWETEL